MYEGVQSLLSCLDDMEHPEGATFQVSTKNSIISIIIKTHNKAIHLTATLLRFVAAGELCHLHQLT
ncbi:MAG TPA: hypothetical protein PLR38_03085, partial [Syntrophorhabdaceae bacterium]|nr:hypothetical protein [Syntrophorhabdaceae bacterium]HOL05082.1 hypothetical protein [Syntrophorhabdaceae bacterium]